MSNYKYTASSRLTVPHPLASSAAAPSQRLFNTMKRTIAALAALAPLVCSASFLVINTPCVRDPSRSIRSYPFFTRTNLVVCQPALLTWSGGARTSSQLLHTSRDEALVLNYIYYQHRTSSRMAASISLFIRLVLTKI